MNRFGLFYIGPDGKRHFYKSFKDMDSLINHVRLDKELHKIEKTKLEVIILSEEEEKANENNH